MKFKLELGELEGWNEPFFKNIHNCGLNIVEDDSADIFVKDHKSVTPEDLESGKKYIILERKDGADIAKKNILKHPAVIRYVKQYKYCNLEWNNYPCVDGREFTRFLSTEADWQMPKVMITDEDYKKVYLGWNFLHYTRLSPFVKAEPDFLRKRNIDVFFIGEVNYGDENHKSGNLISLHRRNCIRILNSIKGLKIVAAEGKQLNRMEYIRALHDSKIIVSPWGWGEACYRDYEAILSGCILIKPNTENVTSSCGIFQQSHNIWVSPDFSDLKVQIYRALNNFEELRDIRIHKRKLLVDASNNLIPIIQSIFHFN